MCRLENRRFRIFIDRDDRLRVIHAGSKLDRTGHGMILSLTDAIISPPAI